MDEVLVLLSTYNGERFINEQLESIFNQEGVMVKVLIRDDGSSDNTCNILEKWREDHNLTYYTGENIGPARSFFDLLVKAPVCKYYAFADQDDIWYPQKLSRAIHVIGEHHVPFLYFCNVNLTDAQGNIIQPSLPPNLDITRHNALIESFASGCAMVFNHSLRTIVSQHIPSEVIYHDRWVFLTAVFFGKVFYDKLPSMGYRQHGGNLVGTKTEKEKSNMIKRILSKGDFAVSTTASLFGRYYGSKLKHSDMEIVRTCTEYRTNIVCKSKLLLSPDYNLAVSSFKRSLYWKLRILFNRL